LTTLCIMYLLHHAEERAMKHLYPALLLARAEASTAQGETERALEQYERAAHCATKMRMRPALWRAHAGMARLLLASGRPPRLRENGMRPKQ
jgi:hypothetical protein